MSAELNPYVSPIAAAGDSQVSLEHASDAEQVRRQYFRHEASVKCIAMFYFYVAVAEGLLSSIVCMAGAAAASSLRERSLDIAFSLAFAVFAAISFVIGRGLHRLHRWAGVIVAVMLALGILAVAVTVVFDTANLMALAIGIGGSSYFFYVFLSRKARTVFSANYREVIRRTPQVRYRISFVSSAPVMILFAVFGLAAAALVLSILFRKA